jgi:hypothetical protein
MKTEAGFAINAVRAALIRTSWAALASAAFGLYFYLAADWNGFGDGALFVALRYASLAAGFALCSAGLAAAADLSAPIFGAPVRLRTLAAALLSSAAALALLLAVGGLRAVLSGLSV